MINPFEDIINRLERIEKLLLEQSKVIPEVEYLTRLEAAAKYGITLPTLDGYTKQGIIKAYRLGSRIRFKKDELDAALKQVFIQ